MKLSRFAAVMLALVIPAAAHAATPVTFNGVCANTATATQAACSPNLYGSYGNSATLAGTNDSTLQVKITAWQSNQSTGAITSAFLGAYSGGFGVTGVQDVYNGAAGGGGTHQIDNVNGYNDFVLLQFNRAVNIQGINLNLYQISGVSGMDSDASIYDASVLTPATWNASINPALLVTNGLYTTSDQYEVAGTSSAGTRGPKSTDLAASGAAGTAYGGQFSKVWLVGASTLTSNKDDGFKLAQFIVTTATPAVPEPATWAMMIVGFGAVGASMRRRRQGAAAQLA